MELVQKLENPQERKKAAHDTSYMLTGIAGRHLKEVLAARVEVPQYNLEINEQTGKYIVAYEDPRAGRTIIPRIRPLPSATMMCPAHTAHWNESLNDNTTSLELFAHAAINQADEFEFFDDRFYVNKVSTLYPPPSKWQKVWKVIQPFIE